MKILITGATGMIGQKLGLALAREGHELHVISRSAARALEDCPFPCIAHEGDLAKGPLPAGVLPEHLDAIVHLMGEPVAEGRWTDAKKQRLVSSRVAATRHLRQSVRSVGRLVAASAIGFYGDRGDEELGESSAPGEDFLARLCVDWEAEVAVFASLGARPLSLRFGIVLGLEGGALPQMLTPFRAGVGGPLGNGRQWMSWIHEDDLVALLLWSLRHPSVEGVANAVAPRPVRNSEMSRLIAERISRPALLPTPTFGLRLLFGEKAGILVASQKVSCARVSEAGFAFKFSELGPALDDLLGPLSRGEDVFMARQYVPRSPEEIFSFFAAAENLERITPPLLNFQIKSTSTPAIQEGTLIEYRLKVHGVPMSWLTRIEDWQPPRKFVDLQLKGPYRLWHHTHGFEPLGAGTLLTDRVRYRLPLGFVGWLGGAALVERDVRKIFAFRRRTIHELFGAPKK